MNHSFGFLPVFFPIPNLQGEDGKSSCRRQRALGKGVGAFNSCTPSVQEVIFKGAAFGGKSRAHWPIFIYSLIPCKLVFFLKIKSKKYFGSHLFASPPGSRICFLYFCTGFSTSLVLMELVSFLGSSLLLMFLLLGSSSTFAVSLTIFFFFFY